MKVATLRPWLLLLVMLALTVMACGFGGGDGVPRNAAAATVVVNSSTADWITAAAAAFNEQEIESADGQQAYINPIISAETGNAIVQMQNGAMPDMWIPDDGVWTEIAADQGVAGFGDDCVSVATSPLVIGMWEDVARSLGWPGRDLGWLDVGSVAADPSAWQYFSGGQYGESLRLSHTHPGLSATGANTLLALVQSAESKTDAVTPTDISQPIVQASVGAFESAVSWFSQETNGLAREMFNRGADFLGAGVMYESDAVIHGNGQIVPIYPLEGTFVATHPACINANSSAEVRVTARLFRDFLLSDEGQALAAQYGLRSTDGELSGPWLSAENSVDPDQPAIIFDAPTVESIYAVQELWRSARKPINLVMLLDSSGSMDGDKIENMISAAAAFVTQMGDEDYLTIVEFYTEPYVIVNHEQVGPSRSEIINTIRALQAGGDTALYDAVALASSVIAGTTSPETSNAMVVLTDGQDTSSISNFDQTLIDKARANGTSLFTIAYGRDAEQVILEQLALAGNGRFYLGTEASIADIYDEMSAAFGGSVGIGR
ncbi:MAG: VWA domain-containing protein [Anaerolineae bacterium]|nr:VWA domain-containing protein [Anaerolineae bacterium]